MQKVMPIRFGNPKTIGFFSRNFQKISPESSQISIFGKRFQISDRISTKRMVFRERGKVLLGFERYFCGEGRLGSSRWVKHRKILAGLENWIGRPGRCHVGTGKTLIRQLFPMVCLQQQCYKHVVRLESSRGLTTGQHSFRWFVYSNRVVSVLCD